MPTHRQTHSLTGALLFLLPSLTAAISLASFQPIKSSNARCFAAYNAEIPNCSPSDFRNGAACSTNCVSSLFIVQTTLENACQGINGPKNSLLGDLLTGGMVVALCPNVAVGTSSPTAAATTQESTTSTTSSSSTSSSSSRSSTTSTRSFIRVTTTSASPTPTPPPPDDINDPNSPFISLPGAAPTSSASVTLTPPSSPTKASVTRPTKLSNQRTNGGGGSPFDNVLGPAPNGASLGPQGSRAGGAVALIVAVAVALGLS